MPRTPSVAPRVVVGAHLVGVGPVEECLGDRLLVEAEVLGEVDVVGRSLDLGDGRERERGERLALALRGRRALALRGRDGPDVVGQREVAQPHGETVAEPLPQLVEELEGVDAVGAGEVAPQVEEDRAVVGASGSGGVDLEKRAPRPWAASCQDA